MRTAVIVAIGAAILVVLILTRPAPPRPAGPPPPVGAPTQAPPPPPPPPVPTATPASYPVPEEFRNEWSGFAPGSSVTFSRFEKSPKAEQSSVDRVTVLNFDPAKVRLKFEKLVNNEPAGTDSQELDIKCDWGARTGAEMVDIDGRTLECQVYFRETQAGGQIERIRRWVSSKAPGRVVREETEVSKGNQKATASGRLTRLNQTMVVGGKTVTYAIWEQTGETVDGTRIWQMRWMTEEVPGFVIKDERRITTIQKQELRTLREVTNFEVK